MNENELVQLVQAAMSGDSKAGQMLDQLMQSDPSIKGMVEQIIQSLQQDTPAMKCGGRVKKKQLGEKIVKAKKASCGCQLKKVGGRLIEVDGCTGLPMHKSGDKIQYAKFGDGIKRFFESWASAAGQSGANFTPGAGSIAGSIVNGTPSGLVGSPAQRSTGYNRVQNQNDRMTYQTFDAWLQENAPEYKDVNKRAELFNKYGMGSIPMYKASTEQNLALWERMKRDKEAGVPFGQSEQIASAQVSSIPLASSSVVPQITFAPLAQVTPDQVRENAIARMSGKRISDRERRKWGEAYDALQSGVNPNDLTGIQMRRIQRLGQELRPKIAKTGGQLNYANYLN